MAAAEKKSKFAPIPLRAMADDRLMARHWRVLAAVAAHDRLGRDRQGCWATRATLAKEIGISRTHVSDMLADLRAWGYVASEPHPTNKSRRVHRVVYEQSNQEADCNQPASTQENRSHPRDLTGPVYGTRQVPLGVLQSLKSQGNFPPNISLKRTLNISLRESDVGTELDKHENQHRIQKSKGTAEEEAVRYLDRIEKQISNHTTPNSLSLLSLASIVDDVALPDLVRDRARNIKAKLGG